MNINRIVTKTHIDHLLTTFSTITAAPFVLFDESEEVVFSSQDFTKETLSFYSPIVVNGATAGFLGSAADINKETVFN